MIDMLRKSAAHVFIRSLAEPELEKEDAHHLLKVLRVTEHDIVTVSDGRGSWITAKLDRNGEIHPLSEIFETAPRKHMLSVAFAPVKGEKPEVIVQKLTELGIDEIIPLAPTRRSVVKWDDARVAKNEERLRKIAREAAMQSRRTWLPSIHSITALADVLAAMPLTRGKKLQMSFSTQSSNFSGESRTSWASIRTLRIMLARVSRT